MSTPFAAQPTALAPPSPGAYGVMPPGTAQPTLPAPMFQAPTQGTSIGGFVPMQGTRAMYEQSLKNAAIANTTTVMTGLVGTLRKWWTWSRTAKQQTVSEIMLQCIRQRRGEYDPNVLAMLQRDGGSQIYMRLTDAKCRSALAWLQDVLLSTSEDDKPWAIKPTPVPELPPDHQEAIINAAAQTAMEFQQSGIPLNMAQMEDLLLEMKSVTLNKMYDEARKSTDLMSKKMQDQLIEGNWMNAMSEFLNDFVTFPSAVLKGPVIRNKPQLAWVQTGGQWGCDVQIKLTMEWERVDPWDIYPSPSATSPQNGFLIEYHKMEPHELEELIGVEGYNVDAITAVLAEYGPTGKGGVNDWTTWELTKNMAEGKSTTAVSNNIEGRIAALQCWGRVSGQELLDWGMDDTQVPVPTKMYEIEAWLIDRWVIKATLNPDKLGRRPYYMSSFVKTPGSFWGQGLCQIIRDVQTMCNVVARAVADNVALASGPQVCINVERVPMGQDITKLHPWQIWQTTSDPMNSAQPPIIFFQPDDRTAQLLNVYDKFNNMADDISGIPRYMAGASAPNVGRTASGLQTMMQNAGKTLKQALKQVDTDVTEPSVERLYYYNMVYGTDPSLKGDIHIYARGSAQLVAQEAASQRRNEFMQLVLNNPMAQQIIGPSGAAALLREAAKGLDMNTDDLVPPAAIMDIKQKIQQRAAQQAAMAAQAQQAAAGGPAGMPGTQGMPPAPGAPGAPAGPSTGAQQAQGPAAPVMGPNQLPIPPATPAPPRQQALAVPPPTRAAMPLPAGAKLANGAPVVNRFPNLRR